MGRICRKDFKSGMKERVSDEKLIIISVTVSGVNVVTFPTYSTQLNSTQLNSTENYGRRCLTPLSPHRNYIPS